MDVEVRDEAIITEIITTKIIGKDNHMVAKEIDESLTWMHLHHLGSTREDTIERGLIVMAAMEISMKNSNQKRKVYLKTVTNISVILGQRTYIYLLMILSKASLIEHAEPVLAPPVKMTKELLLRVADFSSFEGDEDLLASVRALAKGLVAVGA